MPFKVTFIGAGSIGFTRKLFRDILTVPEFRDTLFAFTDISGRNLDMVAQLCRKDLLENRLPATIVSTTNRRRALAGADYVINCARIGGLEAFQSDLDIPLRYGIDQCVGDTLCAGGIMYGQRNIPEILRFCRDIREGAAPDALFLNYANPMAMNTWAAIVHGGVPTLGLCHGVRAGHYQITEVIQLLVNGRKKPEDRGYVKISVDDVDVVCAGINHQTWFIQVRYRGKDWTGRLLEGFQKHPRYSHTEKVRIDILKRFGYYTTESNGHCSEYVAWYRKRTADIPKWIDMSSWIHGETAGYLRSCIESRNWFRTDVPRWLREPSAPIGPETRSREHGSYIIEARETGRVYRGHFNVVNHGCIPNLPDDAIVEVPGYVDRNGINIPRVGPLPPGCAAICNASVSVQRLAVEAAVRGDAALLRQAMMMDPLTGAVCDPEEISQMTDEMLVAQARWLPQYRSEIPAARRRLAAARRDGRYRGIHPVTGAARLQPRLTRQWAQTVLQSFAVSPRQPPVADIRRLGRPSASLCQHDIEGQVSVRHLGFCDVQAVHEGKPGVIYLHASYPARRAGPGRLLYGADGPVKVWINGAATDCHPEATNPARPGQYRARVKWKRGANEILFALSTNGGAATGIYAGAELSPPKGKS